MVRAIIFGAGGHAAVIASLLQNHEVCFVSREAENKSHYDRLISEDFYFKNIDFYSKIPVYIGIGNNKSRAKVFNRLSVAGIVPAICIAPNAFVAASANLGPGCVVCPGSAVMANAQVGVNVIINTLSSVDHDCLVGDHSQITAGVTLGGEVRMGKNCFLGIKAAVVPRVTIGDNVMIMAGSTVTADIDGGVVVGGNPARIVRSLRSTDEV